MVHMVNIYLSDVIQVVFVTLLVLCGRDDAVKYHRRYVGTVGPVVGTEITRSRLDCFRRCTSNTECHALRHQVDNTCTLLKTQLGGNPGSVLIYEEDFPRSCLDHYNQAVNQGLPPSDGVYDVMHRGQLIPVYCDMTLNGGGWMLVVSNVGSPTWTNDNVVSRNINTPGINVEYSILSLVEEIKNDRAPANFQYRLEATGRSRFGGIWRAPGHYSFLKTDESQTGVTELEMFDVYVYGPNSLFLRMMWLDYLDPNAILTTRSYTYPTKWWGTLVMKNTSVSITTHGPGPWIAAISNTENLQITGSVSNPKYYWYREEQ